MPVSFLPNELLIKIFSTVSSPSDLFHVVLVSNRFANIARPFLYRHITIKAKGQRERLMDVRWQDKKLVKKLTIRGDGPVELQDMEDHLAVCKLGQGCIQDLFNFDGQLLNLSTIEVLDIEEVHFHPFESWTFEKCIIAESLIELSISNHQGGRSFWRWLFQSPQSFPSLRRLRLNGATQYVRVDKGNPGAETVRRIKHGVFEGGQLVFERSSSIDPPSLTGLEVYAHDEFITVYADDGAQRVLAFHPLSVGSHWFAAVVWNIFSCTRLLDDDFNTSFTPEFYNCILEGQVRPPSFLSIPAHRSSLSTEIRNALIAIEELGTVIHCDGDEGEGEGEESNAFIPRYFTDYLKRTNFRLRR